MQPESQVSDHSYRFANGYHADRLAAVRHEMEYLNTVGKRFVAAMDRFHVHRALLATLQEQYSFSACCILLKGDPYELFIIPCYPLNASFLEAMIQRIANAAQVMDFSSISAEQLARTAYLDAPDELAMPNARTSNDTSEIGSGLNVPLTVENRIIGMLSLFDERKNTFDADLLRLTTMIADYAAVALENVRLRERENALWRQAELERQRLELIIKSMNEGMLITDADGAISSLNGSAEQLLAPARLDLLSKIPLRTLAKTSSFPWLQELATIVEDALKGKTVRNHELIVGESSETVPLTLSVSVAPLHDTNEIRTRPVGVVAVLNDVTSLKQVERLKDEFVSVVSHELRTPLTAIKGYTQHLTRRIERRIRRTEQPNPDLPENYDLRNLNIIQSQTDHLERLVNDLLDLSRAQWGQLNLHYEDFFLADVLSECVRSVQASAEQHVILLEILVQETVVLADRSRVAQVVGNILDNAVKYSPQGGQVTVRLREQGEDYLVSITDQGIGVSPEHYDHIFERFFRVRNLASRQYSGIGLGLYVTKAIISGHGGKIWFTSNQDIGTTFYFTLPNKPRKSL